MFRQNPDTTGEVKYMQIIVINGSPRTNGLTAAVLHRIAARLEQNGAEVRFIDLAKLEIKPCRGCCTCYQTGSCIYQDDAEALSREIAAADGIVIGTPTYVSNVSGLLKQFIDRGHFVIEQLLHGKYAVSVVTGENYGRRDASAVLGRLFSYSGAYISGRLVINAPFNSLQYDGAGAVAAADRLAADIYRKRTYPLQYLKHQVIFRAGIRPFVSRKGECYRGVTDKWEHAGI